MASCRKAVILAAGRGSRLGALSDETPKCLLPIAGKPLLEHHLDALASAGIDNVTVVVGFEAQRVAALAANRCRIVVNERYASTNSIVSLYLAGPHVCGDAFVFQNADVLYAPALVRRFVAAPHANACLVDPLRAHADHEYHVALDRGRIAAYSRDVGVGESVGESAQLVKIGAPDSARFIDRLGEVIEAGGHNGFPLQAYDVLKSGDGLWPVYTAGLPWWEIDTRDDYARCEADHRAPARNGAGALTLGKLASFVAHPRVPSRYAWMPPAARAGLRHPVRAAGLAGAVHAGRLSVAGLDLQVNGDRMLGIALHEAERAGFEPFLLWGSLLGCVRDGGFIYNDRDIDFGVLEDDAPKVSGWREAMVARGFVSRIANAHKVSVVHRRHPRLFIDVNVVHRRGDEWAIVNTTSDPGRICRYVFARSVFGETRASTLGRRRVRLPADPEGFLEATYGEWRIPQAKMHYLYGPLNLEIENARARGVSSLTLRVTHFRKEVLEVDRQWGLVRVRPPNETRRKNFRPIVRRAPSLDDSGVEVHDPVLGHPLVLVEAPLHVAIGASRGG